MVKRNRKLFFTGKTALPPAASVVYMSLLLLPVCFGCFPAAASGQHRETTLSLSAGPPGSGSKPVILPDEGISGYFMIGDSIINEFHGHAPGEAAGVIVRFATPPLAEFMVPGEAVINQRLKNYKSAIETDHQRFRSDLAAIESRIREIPGMQKKSLAGSIKREYFTVLNGVALSAPGQVIDEIRRLPYVKDVSEDREVYALLDKSTRLIGAEELQNNHGLTGKGIVIGIVDTGIDYMHPDMGGGLGPGFKVVGGYDFVNDNDDPMDDNSHGTHVAGIAAANGKVRGVAPGAALRGYKVLDHNGRGSASNVIAGIEQAVIDKVHILNFSLGSAGGKPDDPLSAAVDNAMAAGLVCVVAAGNTGSRGYQSITSPGAARSAITVGATDLNDDIAPFSSRGPSNVIYGVKPEIVAPGVLTTAPVLNKGYDAKSGTSMSAPHVAGAAALLLEKDDGLLPVRVKSILLQSAVDIGLDIWTQGAGRIDIQQAAGMAGLIVVPAILNFGIADLAQDNWIATETISIYNYHFDPQWVELSPGGGFPAGVDFSFSPAGFSLPPGETMEVTVSLTVDINSVPFPQTDPMSYSGGIDIISEQASSSVPAVFIKSSVLKMVFDAKPYRVVLFNEKEQELKIYEEFDRSLELEALVQPGIYDIIVSYDDYRTTVIRENISVGEFTLLEIEKAEAGNHIVIKNLNRHGEAIEPTYTHERYTHRSRKFSWGLTRVDLEERFFSDYDNYEWYWTAWESSHSDQRHYIMGDGLLGSSSDVTQEYDPGKLKHIELTHNKRDGHTRVMPLVWLNTNFFSSAPHTGPPLELPFTQTFYMSPNLKYEQLGLSLLSKLYSARQSPWERSGEELLFSTPYLSNDDNDSLVAYRRYEDIFEGPLTEAGIIEQGNFNAGQGPPGWYGELFISREHLQLFNAKYLFLSQLGDWHYDHLPYRLYGGGELLQEGDLLGDFTMHSHRWPYNMEIRIPDGIKYDVFEIDYNNFQVHGQQGSAMVKIKLGGHGTPRYLPRLRSFHILTENEHTDNVVTGKQNSIQFEIKKGHPDPDIGRLSALALEWRAGTDGEWAELETAVEGDLYHTPIPGHLPQGFISLRITAADQYDGSLEYTIEPAFYKDGTAAVHIISASAGENGKIDPAGDVGVEDNGRQVFSIVADQGYRVYDVTVNGESAGAVEEYIFDSVTGDQAIHAEFAVKTYAVSFSVADALSGEAITGAVITFDGIRHDAGVYVIEEVLPETYDYTAEKPGYFDIGGSVTVADSDQEVILFMDADITAITEPGERGLTVYPNPAEDMITIEFDNPGSHELSIVFYNLQGQRVKYVPVYQTGLVQLSVNLNDLMPGTYLLVLRGEKDFPVQKVIKR
jgi:hypothetical protein